MLSFNSNGMCLTTTTLLDSSNVLPLIFLFLLSGKPCIVNAQPNCGVLNCKETKISNLLAILTPHNTINQCSSSIKWCATRAVNESQHKHLLIGGSRRNSAVLESLLLNCHSTFQRGFTPCPRFQNHFDSLELTRMSQKRKLIYWNPHYSSQFVVGSTELRLYDIIVKVGSLCSIVSLTSPRKGRNRPLM
jgi:hypothetical protein